MTEQKKLGQTNSEPESSEIEVLKTQEEKTIESLRSRAAASSFDPQASEGSGETVIL